MAYAAASVILSLFLIEKMIAKEDGKNNELFYSFMEKTILCGEGKREKVFAFLQGV